MPQVAREKPTCVTIAARDLGVCKQVQVRSKVIPTAYTTSVPFVYDMLCCQLACELSSEHSSRPALCGADAPVNGALPVLSYE